MFEATGWTLDEDTKFIENHEPVLAIVKPPVLPKLADNPRNSE